MYRSAKIKCIQSLNKPSVHFSWDELKIRLYVDSSRPRPRTIGPGTRIAKKTSADPLGCAIARQVWERKYRFKAPGAPVDRDITDTWKRVAHAMASAEMPSKRQIWADTYYQAMSNFQFLPAGRILSGAGTGRETTLMNTFVMGTIDDSIAGIMEVARQAALTMHMGGGLGYDFSTLSPKGLWVEKLGSEAPGPLAAMDLCDAVCKLTMNSSQRGAMMATLRCDHPDIEEFICAKNDPSRLRHFNLSVLVTDDFMNRVENNQEMNLVWKGQTVKSVQARDLWQKIMVQAYKSAEPGVLFIDRINDLNPLRYMETISATNSCAEQPLPPFGTAPLGSINFARLVNNPFEANAGIDTDRLAWLVRVAVRMLDNVIDVTDYPLPEQQIEAKSKRRIGLGVTGIADAMLMLGVRYGSDEAAELLNTWMKVVHDAAIQASIELAQEKGPCPALNIEAYLATPAGQTLDPHLRQAIKVNGVRNAVVTSIAPAGSISILAGNVSSGIEPIFAKTYKRKFKLLDGRSKTEVVKSYAVKLYQEKYGEDKPLPCHTVTAMDITPEDHVKMQAVAQRWVDGSISKTVNCPESISIDEFQGIYRMAYSAGCKGCTTYRPNPITGSILSV